MHNKNCSCFECNHKPTGDDYLDRIKARGLKAYIIDETGRYAEDYADKPVQSADRFLDSKLVAKTAVTARQSPNDNAPIIKQFPKGTNVGVIQSWVVRDGQVWWDVNWFSGKHMGWVKHNPDLFDSKIAEQTASGKAHEETVKKIDKIMTEKSAIEKLADGVSSTAGGLGDSLAFLGKNLKLIIIGAIVFVIVLNISKLRAS